ncbi:GNAT family N-acetyltransferase [Peribacillus sp. NPDC006672]|uniref:GNAT family N-acetyltransferase n=1 Tax=Peribacillus sp. NPDC006672 TaxID=3390606 RepID=UPI003D00170E
MLLDSVLILLSLMPNNFQHQKAINKAKEIDDVEKINLTVVTSNQKAKNLYTNLGFKVFGFEEKALKVNGVYYDEEHMVLCLDK